MLISLINRALKRADKSYIINIKKLKKYKNKTIIITENEKNKIDDILYRDIKN